nr:cation diffusion facilitator family transporter [uncultured Solibaculum sp.]
MTSLLVRFFVKDHQNTKDPKVRQKYGVLGGSVGIVCNILLCIAKLIAGTLTNSVSITADAFNNLSDAGSSAVTVLGFKLSGKKPDQRHPFGYGRAEYVAGLIISFLILMVGVELIKSSVDKIMNPEILSFSWISAGILLLSILVKLWLALFNRKLGQAIESKTVEAASMDSLSDMIATGAVLLSLILSPVLHLPLDGYMGILVALFVLWAGISIARDTLSPLLGQAPDPELVQSIESMLLSYDMISGAHDLIVHNYGPGRIIASVHAEVPCDCNILSAHEVIDQAEREISAALNIVLVVHLDPIVTDDKRINHLKAHVLSAVREIDERLSVHDFRVVDGENRVNLVFDVVVPFQFELTDDQLSQQISTKLSALNPIYHAVIHFDRSYV